MSSTNETRDARVTEIERRVEVRNEHGLHARPAAEFVKLASSFEAKIQVVKDDLEVNGKSIMGVLMLAAEPGAELLLRADGPDAEDAVEALAEFVRSDGGEIDGADAEDRPGEEDG